MRVLLDENLPRRIKRRLEGHEVWTAPEAGLAGKKNGELLRAAAGKFDVFVTFDKNLQHQQNLKGISFGIILLRARSNKIAAIIPLLDKILPAIQRIKPGEVIVVGG